MVMVFKAFSVLRLKSKMKYAWIGCETREMGNKHGLDKEGTHPLHSSSQSTTVLGLNAKKRLFLIGTQGPLASIGHHNKKGGFSREESLTFRSFNNTIGIRWL